MPVVLIVDDSEVDRRLVGGLLPKDLEWLIEFADNGVEALEKMRLSLPDVVITDMLMPQMDGMELVSNIRVDYPHIPVILITGHGNETLAVEALEKGATSYVPKQLLAAKLQETVEQVLAVAKADRSYSRLISCLKTTQYSFELDNDPALIPPLVDLLQQILAGMRCCDATGRMHAGIALEEALLNAVLAGNLEMERDQVLEARSQLRQGYVSQLVKTRRAQSPYVDARDPRAGQHFARQGGLRDSRRGPRFRRDARPGPARSGDAGTTRRARPRADDELHGRGPFQCQRYRSHHGDALHGRKLHSTGPLEPHRILTDDHDLTRRKDAGDATRPAHGNSRMSLETTAGWAAATGRHMAHVDRRSRSRVFVCPSYSARRLCPGDS